MAAMTTTVNTIHSKLTENPLPTKWIEPKKPPFRKVHFIVYRRVFNFYLILQKFFKRAF